MACRSCCIRQLSQASTRRAVFPTATTTITEAPSSQWLVGCFASRQRPRQQSQQRRNFRSSAAQREKEKSWVPDSVRKVGAEIMRRSIDPYKVHGSTELIYKTCAREAAYTISETDRRNGTVAKTEEGEEIGVGTASWHKDLNLPPTFSTWSQVTMLHMYLIYARVRDQERDSAISWQKQLVDHFFFDAEEKMDIVHGITSRGLRQRYLKDLFIQWRGIIAAYDEGVIKGDAVLAAALWRNVFKARADVNVRHLAALVSWMRLCLRMLDSMADEDLFLRADAALQWPPRNEFMLVDAPTRQLEGLLPEIGGRPKKKPAQAVKQQAA